MHARTPARVAGSLLLLAVAGLGSAVAADTPQAWLERMVASAGQVSFRGTLVHMCGGKVDVVNVVHRVEDGRVTERVRALDADGREIIRNPEEVMCILPDQKTVMVDSGPAGGEHVDALLSPAASFAKVSRSNYRLQMLGKEHVAGQATEVIAIRPTDDLRYGYRLWLERNSAMPLKYELISETGEPLEQTLFTEIQFAQRIAAAEVEPTIVMDNFMWQREGARAPASAVAAGEGRWRVADMPAGFSLQTAESRTADADNGAMEHLVYSDGLAAVSIFIEADVADAEREPGRSEMGAVNAYTTLVDGYLVTAVGGVPIRTVEQMALSVERSAESH